MDNQEQHFPNDEFDQDEPLVGDAPPQSNTLLSNKAYDVLKQAAQIWLPALAVFYITIAPLWELPKQEAVSGTIMAFDLLLGAFLGLTKRQYMNSDARFDGAINVESFEDHSNLNVQLDPAAISGKDEVTVKVNRV